MLKDQDQHEHGRRVFSVDDDPEEIEDDLRRLENLNEVVKYAIHGHKQNATSPSPQPQLVPQGSSASFERSTPELTNIDPEAVTAHLAIDHDAASTASSVESYTLRERQDAINETHPFGIRIWKPALYKKRRSVQNTADTDIRETKFKRLTWSVYLSNWVWTLTFGLALWILCLCASIFIYLFGLGFYKPTSWEYSQAFYQLGKYLLCPFGKIVYITRDERYLEEDHAEGITFQQFYKWISLYRSKLFPNKNSTNACLTPGHPSYGSIQEYISQQQNNQRRTGSDSNDALSATAPQKRYFGRGSWNIGRLLFYLIFHTFIQPIILLLSLLMWLGVFTIPMANILWKLMYHYRKHPLALGFKSFKDQASTRDTSDKNILMCTLRCAGLHYYKYTVDGTNVLLVNLVSIVFFTIIDFYFFKELLEVQAWFTNESTIFILCLASIIPLAFYIGQAVASVSAQTSMGVGAVINAFFSTVVEIFLYCVALNQSKGLLVEGSMIGSILAAVLLLPGLSMCGGALKRKTQRYNPASAGVSSALLIFSMIVIFVPTILYEIYGPYSIVCDDKDNPKPTCQFEHPPLRFTELYIKLIQPMSASCAVILFFAYIIGLWFTLRTHAKLIWELRIADGPKQLAPVNTIESNQNASEREADMIIPQESQDNSGGHEAPNWSRTKSTCILLVATLLYAMVAEILVSCVDSILEELPGLDPKFLGLTIFALVPSTTEFVNAISFAIHGNVALSMEIGSAYALQVCLLQIPALVLYSVFYTWNMDHSVIDIRNQMFALVFPQWDLVGTAASVFLFTYLYAEGKSNYFKGSMLILLYIIVVLGFYFLGMVTN